MALVVAVEVVDADKTTVFERVINRVKLELLLIVGEEDMDVVGVLECVFEITNDRESVITSLFELV